MPFAVLQFGANARWKSYKAAEGRGGGVLLPTLLVVAIAVAIAVDVIVEMEKPHENGIGDRETTANERCMNANARLA